MTEPTSEDTSVRTVQRAQLAYLFALVYATIRLTKYTQTVAENAGVASPMVLALISLDLFLYASCLLSAGLLWKKEPLVWCAMGFLAAAIIFYFTGDYLV